MVALITDFNSCSDEQLRQMLAAGNPGSVRTAADLWRQVGRTLQERGDDVHAQLTTFSPYWKGGAADQYKRMMAEFVGGLDDVAGLIVKTRDLVYSAADDLYRAQSQMPAVVSVPELSPTTSTLMVLPATVAATTWSELSDGQRLQVTDELKQHQALTEQATTARRQAVAVLSQLAARDLVTEESIPHLPVAGDPPPVPANEAAATTVATKVASQDWPVLDASTPEAVQTAAVPPSGPLFRDMYAAGSLAASAAVLGRFRLGSGWLARQKAEKEQKAKQAAADAQNKRGSSPHALTGGLPRAGGGSPLGGSGAGGGVIGAVPEPPRANPVLTGGAVPSGSANPALVAGLGSGSGAASGGSTGGMMPPMMPPMGGGGADGVGRRIPPWLVETEQVFGDDPVAGTPTVIGELPDEPSGRGWRSSG